MNLKLLKEVIVHIKKTMKCPHCKTTFRDNNMHIIGTLPDEAFFQLYCPKCKANLLLHTAVETHRKHRKITTQKHHSIIEPDTISKDEVLDMHNFLKTFDGNFNSAFKNHK
ncbi:hypothetical protein KKG71_01125 [Patescibacteria group bacterium]|nr:hypothetical protein [Patescibacteria group bacterium]